MENNEDKEKQKEELNECGLEAVDEIGRLKTDLEACGKEKDQYLNNWKRERADLINYKKEEVVRTEEATRYRKEELILKILPVLDSFYLAEAHLPDGMAEDQYVSGLLQIKIQLENFLKAQGVEEIQVSGDDFDPAIQEAVETGDGAESNKVLAIIKKGYMLSGKIIRPMQVKVSK